MSSEDARTSVTVTIAGEVHTIRSDAEAAYTEACARFVDGCIAEIRNQSTSLERHRAAILAALSITDRYFKARDELEEVRGEVASRAQDLARRLDAEVESDTPPSSSGRAPR